MSAGSMVHCQLWMGGLEPYMTESFILASFQRMGEKPLNVKVMRNKFTGEPAGYCFVHFENDDEAIDAMHKLNGKIIPNTNPAVRFRLNTATNQGKIMMNDREFSLWVGDLTSEVDDYTLYKAFAAKYNSIKAAKVILDATGYSKGFGFLRFGSEDEQKHCLVHMNGYKGLGTKPLKISNAIPKAQRVGAAATPSTNGSVASAASNSSYGYSDYSQYYDQSYWQNYSQWNYGYDPNSGYSYDPSSYAQYGQQYPQQYSQYSQQYSQYPQYSQQQYTQYPQYYQQPQTPVVQAQPPAPVVQPVQDDSMEIVEHSPPIDVEKENNEYSEAILSYLTDKSSAGMCEPSTFQNEMEKRSPSLVCPPSVKRKFDPAQMKIARDIVLSHIVGPALDAFQKLKNSNDDSRSGGESEPEESTRKKPRRSKNSSGVEEMETEVNQEETKPRKKSHSLKKAKSKESSQMEGEGKESIFTAEEIPKIQLKTESETVRRPMTVDQKDLLKVMANVDMERWLNDAETMSEGGDQESVTEEDPSQSQESLVILEDNPEPVVVEIPSENEDESPCKSPQMNSEKRPSPNPKYSDEPDELDEILKTEPEDLDDENSPSTRTQELSEVVAVPSPERDIQELSEVLGVPSPERDIQELPDALAVPSPENEIPAVPSALDEMKNDLPESPKPDYDFISDFNQPNSFSEENSMNLDGLMNDESLTAEDQTTDFMIETDFNPNLEEEEPL